MNIPKELKYTKTHEWVAMTGDDGARIGLTDFAQQELGDLVFINLPEVGSEIAKEQPFCDVESVKAVSDVYSPVSAMIVSINEELEDQPELINYNPYGAWIAEVDHITDTADFLTAEEYEEFCAQEV